MSPKIIVDAITQPFSAGKELETILHSWEWNNMRIFGGKEGTDWETTKSADAPLDNGCSEFLIRSTNICLKRALLSMLSIDVFLHTDSSIWIFEWLMVNCI